MRYKNESSDEIIKYYIFKGAGHALVDILEETFARFLNIFSERQYYMCDILSLLYFSEKTVSDYEAALLMGVEIKEFAKMKRRTMKLFYSLFLESVSEIQEKLSKESKRSGIC